MKYSGLAVGITVSFLVTLGILHAQKANALGDTEEGILWGLGIYKIYDVLTEEEQEGWEPGVVYNTGNEFPPFRCQGDGISCAYQQGVYEKEKEEWYDKKQKAYECGRYGRNCDQ
jgi:hypothetical protein